MLIRSFVSSLVKEFAKLLYNMTDKTQTHTAQFGSASTDTLYSPLPKNVLEQGAVVKVKKKRKAQGDFVSSYLKKTLPEGRLRKGEDKELEHKAQVLDNTVKKKKDVKHTPAKQKKLTCKDRRKLRIFELSDEHKRFDMYLPMLKLWTEYIKKTFGLDKKKTINPTEAREKLLKADLHGCCLSVQRSTCPSYVGITGIVIQETRNTFKLVTEDNKIKCIPKRNSVFMFEVDNHCFTIHGNNFRVMSAQRSVYRFKSKSHVII